MKSNRRKHDRIVLVGAYPPPPGGNAVHIQRLQRKLHNEQIYCDVIDIYHAGEDITSEFGTVYRVGGPRPLALLRTMKLMSRLDPDLLHIHVSAFANFSMAAIFLNLAVPRRTRLAMTMHSGRARQGYASLSRVKKIMVQRALKRFDKVITVNEDQMTFLGQLGIASEKMKVIPAFLYPEVHGDYKTLEKSLMLLRQDGRKVICSSGMGIPLYGYEKIIEAISISPSVARKFSLVICVYNLFDDIYMDEVKRLLTRITNSLLLINLDSDEFNFILSKSDVYIRATDRDGDAVAIREANMLQVPVIASDTVDRPDYCYLFELGNSNNLAMQIEKATEDDMIKNCTKVSSEKAFNEITEFLHILTYNRAR